MYKDTIIWYLNKNNFNSCTYQFFTRVIGCSDVNTSYDTLNELNSFPLSKSQQEFPVYSVEFNEEGRLVLSVDFYAGRFVPTSIALISLDSLGRPFMIAKIVTNDIKGSSSVSASISRIFDIPIPKFELGGTYHYPSFETVYKRKSGTPIGEEKVMIGEHHHAVRTGDTNDSYPSLYSGQDNFIMGAQNALPSEIEDSKSYVFGERGNLVSGYTDLLGVKATQNSINITDRDSASIMADILADVLEVIIMANNKIQILGKSIPIYNDNNGNIPVDERSKQYILMTDNVSQSNVRQLKAIDTEKFKSWIISKSAVGSVNQSIDLTSTITVIKSQFDFSLNPVGGRKLAIVFNTNAVLSKSTNKNEYCDKDNLNDGDITVTAGGIGHDIHASSAGYFYCNEGLSWEFYSDTFAYNSLVNILNGDYQFESLDIKGKVKSQNSEVTGTQNVGTFVATNLTVNGTSKLNTITKLDDASIDGITLSSKLKFGDSFISSDNSATFKSGSSTTSISGSEISTPKVTATTEADLPKILHAGGITLSNDLKFGSNSINSSGGISFGSGNLISSAGEITTSSNINAPGIQNGSSCVVSLESSGNVVIPNMLKFRNSGSIYVSDSKFRFRNYENATWYGIDTSGVYIQQ